MSIKLVDTSAKGIETYRIENGTITAEIITYGARIHRLLVKNANGETIDVVAGFNTADGYTTDNPYFNAVIGRVGNRIGKAQFTLDRVTYHLAKNDGNNHLHGGNVGFDKRIWSAKINGDKLELSYHSPNGEENYPSALDATVVYSLCGNALCIDYYAQSDGKTLCSLTNHAYFNLSGDFNTKILDHVVTIDADGLSDIDNELIPTGKVYPTKNTPYDFSLSKAIGKDIATDDRYLKIAGGYDFNFVINGTGYRKVASAYCPRSGIKMEVHTDRCGLQFYTGNFLDGLKGKTTYQKQTAFCMETQGFPNSCNLTGCPSMTLDKGEKYETHTAYLFSLEG